MSTILESEAEQIYSQRFLGDELPRRFGFSPDFQYSMGGADGAWRTAKWWRDRDTFTVYVTPKKRRGWKARVRIVTDSDTEVKVERET